MANNATRSGHLMLDDGSASGVPGGALAHAGVEATLERVLLLGRGAVGDIAAGAATAITANHGDDSVSILDGSAQAVETLVVDGVPLAVVIADHRAFVATSGTDHDAVSVIDLDTGNVTATFRLAFGITALAASPDGKRAYAARVHDAGVDIAVIDTAAERIGTIDIGRGPAAGIDALRVDPSGRRLYVAVTDDNGSQLIVVDAERARVQRVIGVGSPIRDIAYAGNVVYVLTSDRAVGGAVHVLDLSSHAVTDTIALGGAPTQLALSPDLSRAYVVDYDRIVVLCTLTLEVVDSLTVDARPSCVALSPEGTRLYVADCAGAVSVFTVSSTLEEIYTQFLVSDPILMGRSRERELQPVTA
ncbi:YncE family protein [Mycobacterium sp. Y57]|uniref:YncE family protein n=1 Tax=Mycolicibacterium xanthum TaxID=2796469 RepID=UPI001C847116|nr:YncE family protein [Mycolicibacterium xanthum]MBX7435114.1 YncE family protein [Mycolicibacterium xanthum]